MTDLPAHAPAAPDRRTGADRRTEALLSLCAADALGAATEFKSPDSIRAQYGEQIRTYQPGSVFGFAPGEATDDSQMTVATLLGYRQAAAADPESRHRAVLAALRDTDSVYFANNPERHRIAGSTSGTRFSPSRIRSD
ncbi:ADP-ribosylglycohydrolase family protein [Deinococcus caeni]|uniref:ADP-ribosylglycohydrolase n=1 Tax=Deinococcus caeni TaxID=569127 RepID=A0ABP9UBF5_9DEIO